MARGGAMNDLQKRTIVAIVNVFETGKIAGNYSAVGVMAGDSGHLSYGRSQTTLGGGGLFDLLTKYGANPQAQFGQALSSYLPRVQGKDFTLDHDAGFIALLKQAGTDPAMRATQDDFFEQKFFVPACQAAARMGIVSVLGQAVVYDSWIQGGFSKVSGKLPSVAAAGGEQVWVGQYVAARRVWLLQCAPPLPSTVYRMDGFLGLIANGNWSLTLPVTVHGITISAAAL
jgi:chitosanase